MTGPISKPSENPLAQLAQDLRPGRLLPGLVAGLVTGILNVMLAMSLAALIFSGELAARLPTGIGMVLIGDAVVGTLIALTSSHPSSIAVSQDVPAAILAPVVAAALVGMPSGTGDAQRFFTAVLLITGATLLTGLCFLALGYFKLREVRPFSPLSGHRRVYRWDGLALAYRWNRDHGRGPVHCHDPAPRYVRPLAAWRRLRPRFDGCIEPRRSSAHHPRCGNRRRFPVLSFRLGRWGPSLPNLRAQGWLLGEFSGGWAVAVSSRPNPFRPGEFGHACEQPPKHAAHSANQHGNVAAQRKRHGTDRQAGYQFEPGINRGPNRRAA